MVVVGVVLVECRFLFGVVVAEAIAHRGSSVGVWLVG